MPATLKCVTRTETASDFVLSGALKVIMLPGGAAVPAMHAGAFWQPDETYTLTDGEASALLQTFPGHFEAVDDRAREIVSTLEALP
jgi:hypothetical protein